MELQPRINHSNGKLKKSEKKLITLLTIQLCQFDSGELGIQEQITILEAIGKAAGKLSNIINIKQDDSNLEDGKCEMVCQAMKEAVTKFYS